MPSKKQLLDVIAVQTEIAKLGLDLGGTMELVVESTLRLLDADGAAIELAEGDEMVYRAASGIASAQLGLRLQMSSSLSGMCVRTGEILRCDDSENDPRVDREACRQVGLRSMIVVPLCHQGETVGILKAMSARSAKFSKGDVTVLGLLSEVIAAAMYFAEQYDKNELFHRATHDAMTGLANRALFIDRLRTTLARYERDKKAAGVLMIDMDGLKTINDRHGHRVGDAVITEFAKRLKASARLSDTVARLGGDEFGILLSPVEAAQGTQPIVQRIYDEILSPVSFEGKTYPLGASIGAAEIPMDGMAVDDLLDIADQRMYQMKHKNRPSAGMAHDGRAG